MAGRRARGGSDIVNLDSLMDILSCLVGVMLFLVIYTVLELGAATYEAEVPIGYAPAPGSRGALVLAEDGRIRVLDVRRPLGELLAGFEIVRSFSEVPLFIEGNPRASVDQYFTYTLSYEERLSSELRGTLDLEIEAREGAVGDSLHQLGPDSGYGSFLAGASPEDTWIAFAVDSTSVDAFRRAREMAVSRGFSTRWNMYTLDFPLTHAVLRSVTDDWLTPPATQFKPLR